MRRMRPHTRQRRRHLQRQRLELINPRLQQLHRPEIHPPLDLRHLGLRHPRRQLQPGNIHFTHACISTIQRDGRVQHRAPDRNRLAQRVRKHLAPPRGIHDHTPVLPHRLQRQVQIQPRKRERPHVHVPVRALEITRPTPRNGIRRHVPRPTPQVPIHRPPIPPPDPPHKRLRIVHDTRHHIPDRMLPSLHIPQDPRHRRLPRQQQLGPVREPTHGPVEQLPRTNVPVLAIAVLAIAVLAIAVLGGRDWRDGRR